MEKLQDYLYRKGYVAGYRDGIRDAARGRTENMIDNDVTNLPIQAMAVSTRARNCLHGAGCVYIADVVALSEHRIATMRNLGSKTASEIALWLDEKGIHYSVWSKYL